MRQQEFIEAAQKIEWDLAHMAKRTVLDSEQYLRLFCGWVIEDWRGLTGQDLARLVLLDAPKKARLVPDIGCDEAAKLLLMRHSPVFNNWINQVTRDIERFNREREEDAEKKPSRPSASGSTTPASTAGSAETTSRRTALRRNVTTARSSRGTERPALSWRCMTRPAHGASSIMRGWKQRLTIWLSGPMNAHSTDGWCWPCIAV